MITYDELSPELQQKSVRYQLNLICYWISEGYEVNVSLQDRIEAAWEKANKQYSPWFIIEYLREDTELWNELNDMALEQAKNTMYTTEDTAVVHVRKIKEVELS
jgi:hypothetical protein